MISDRVAAGLADDAEPVSAKHSQDEWVIVPGPKGCRVYELRTGYSQVSGQTLRTGPVVRRWDPDAGAQEGKPAVFATMALAEAYIRRWLDVPKPTRKPRT